jgi:hypothetical protein
MLPTPEHPCEEGHGERVAKRLWPKRALGCACEERLDNCSAESAALPNVKGQHNLARGGVKTDHMCDIRKPVVVPRVRTSSSSRVRSRSHGALGAPDASSGMPQRGTAER